MVKCITRSPSGIWCTSPFNPKKQTGRLTETNQFFYRYLPSSDPIPLPHWYPIRQSFVSHTSSPATPTIEIWLSTLTTLTIFALHYDFIQKKFDQCSWLFDRYLSLPTNYPGTDKGTFGPVVTWKGPWLDWLQFLSTLFNNCFVNY